MSKGPDRIGINDPRFNSLPAYERADVLASARGLEVAPPVHPERMRKIGESIGRVNGRGFSQLDASTRARELRIANGGHPDKSTTKAHNFDLIRGSEFNGLPSFKKSELLARANGEQVSLPIPGAVERMQTAARALRSPEFYKATPDERARMIRATHTR